MCDYKRRGIASERGFDNLAGVDAGTVNSATEHFFMADDAVPVVKEDGDEHFMFAACQLGLEPTAGGIRGCQSVAFQHPLFINPFCFTQNVFFVHDFLHVGCEPAEAAP